MPSSHPSFPRFQNLPTELRLKIWALYPGRIILITPSWIGFKVRPTVAPSLLGVNHESRTQFQKTNSLVDLAPSHRLTSGAYVPLMEYNSEAATAARSIWIDWTRDTLFIGEYRLYGWLGNENQLTNLTMARLFHVPALQHLQYIAIPVLRNGSAAALCAALPSLRGITLVGYDETAHGTGRHDVYNAESSFFSEAPANSYKGRRVDFETAREKGELRPGLRVRFCDVLYRRDEEEMLRDEARGWVELEWGEELAGTT